MSRTKAANEVSDAIAQLRAGLKPLDLDASLATAEAHTYLDFYSLKFDTLSHRIGTIETPMGPLAAQIFLQPDARGTVVLSHGYFDHSGVLKHLVSHLVNAGYTVATLDHIGHGLSPGTPAAINDFGDYVKGFNRWLEICREEFSGPLHLVGHSMGCSIILDSLLTGRKLPVDRIVMLAPLVRPAGWIASELALKLGGAKLDSIPRKFLKNSSDPEFLAFHRNDPLQARAVPTSWIKAHRSWYDRIQSAESSQEEIRILQGDADRTVDWKFNLRFLQQRIPNAEVEIIGGGKHQLANEPLPLRQEVFEKIEIGLQS